MKKTLTTSTFLTAAIAVILTVSATADVRIDAAVRLIDAGTIKSFEAPNNAALEQHPGTTIYDTELKKKQGRYTYEVELRDKSG